MSKAFSRRRQRPFPTGVPMRTGRGARASGGAVVREFVRGERGNVAIETALALVGLLTAFVFLVDILGDAYAEDRADRAARSMAYALALDPDGALPWHILESNGGIQIDYQACGNLLPDDDTATCGGWTLTVYRDVGPADLAKVLAGEDPAGGEMVLVKLEKQPAQQAQGNVTPAIWGGNAPIFAFGAARHEPGS